MSIHVCDLCVYVILIYFLHVIHTCNIQVDVPRVYVHTKVKYMCVYLYVHVDIQIYTHIWLCIHTYMYSGYVRTPRKYHPRVYYLYICHRSMYICIVHARAYV